MTTLAEPYVAVICPDGTIIPIVKDDDEGHATAACPADGWTAGVGRADTVEDITEYAMVHAWLEHVR